MIGEKVAMPVALAPTGLTGMQHADGEMLAAQAAEEFGVPFTLSTMSICSIEDVASVTKKPFWFQLYVMRDRDFVAQPDRPGQGGEMLGAGADARPADPRPAPQGLRATACRRRRKLTPKHIWQMATRPRWCLGMLGTKRRTFRNIVGHAKGVGDLSSLSSWTTEQFDPQLSWKDVAWIKERWGGKLILKGILDAEDARMAAETGADAIIVSNHGGRQLDGAPSSISVLPAIVDAVGDTHRGAYGRRHPLRPGRAEGAVPRRQGHLYRPAVPLRPRRARQGRRHAWRWRSSARSWTSRWRCAASG